jgi:hypothetical protein
VSNRISIHAGPLSVFEPLLWGPGRGPAQERLGVEDGARLDRVFDDSQSAANNAATNPKARS